MNEKPCGCCEGTEILTPRTTANRPGLSALAYRVGTHATFLQTMQARLSSTDYPELAGLTTRDTADPSIALLDAWATLGDVLTFYQERIANEGYLRTATERRSVLELARLVGYRLRPGVASSVYLAFELDKDAEVEIPIGTRAQSLPGPGQLPQPFETADPLLARAVWNAVKPRLTRPQIITLIRGAIDVDTLYLEGITTNLKPNDPLLFVFEPEGCQGAFDRVKSIEIDADANCTKVTLQGLGEQRITASQVEEIGKTMEGYLDLVSFGVLGTQMAERVSPMLEEISHALRPDMASREMVVLLDGILSELKREHDQAVAGGFSKLEPWVGALVAELEARRSQLVELAQNPSSGVQMEWGESAKAQARSPLAGLGGLVTPLLRDPSVQPANALRLEPDLQVTFSEKSDALPRLLTRFQPRLRGTLYKAWAQAPIGRPPDIQRVEALRVKAAPFGHNAPLKPILDEEGRIVGHEEWLLANMVTTRVGAGLPGSAAKMAVLAAVVGPSAEGGEATGRNITISIEEGAKTPTRHLPLPDSLATIVLDQHVSLGDHRVRIAIGPMVSFVKTIADTDLDVYVDGKKIEDLMWHDTEMGIMYTTYRGDLRPGKHRFQFVPQDEEPTAFRDLEIEAGKLHSVVAAGDAADIRIVHLGNDRMPSQAKARVRLVHVADDVSEPIAAKLLVEDTGEELAIFPEVTFAQDRDRSHYQEFSPPVDRTLELQIQFGDKSVAWQGLRYEAGMIYDIYICRDPESLETAPRISLEQMLRDLRGGAATFGFEDLGRIFRLYLDNSNKLTPITVEITDGDKIWEWGLSVDQRIQQTVDHGTVIIDLAQQRPFVSYQALVPRNNILILDKEYDQITRGSCLVIERPSPTDSDQTEVLIRRVKQARTVSSANYGISAQTTQLTLDADWLYESDTDLSVLRNTTVSAQGEALALAEMPIDTTDHPQPIGGKRIELDGVYDGLEPGRWIIVSGERCDITDDQGNSIPGIQGAELVMLAAVEQSPDEILPGDKPHTVLVLANDLEYTYKRDTVIIYGNVVKATHGETREEVLGSGDGSKWLQAFVLKQSPLTYLAAPTPSGAESTLQVRVNDVRWHETQRLVDQEPSDRVYATRSDDESKTTVLFGDGQHGARLPTGVENVKAKYCSGIGKVGNLPAEQISLLATRPLGVKGVINPLPATGGADRESRDQARRNAPLGVTALDRLVSVQDYADFCRSYAGIGKARAASLTSGRRQVVHVTIAGADDIPIDKQSDLYRNLVQALIRHGDPHLPLQVDLRELMFLIISANVRLLPDYLWESVEPRIRAALLEALGFDQRALGQDVLLGEVISAVQKVSGVAYVDVDILGAIPEKTSDGNGRRRLLTPEEILVKVEEIIQASTATGRPPPRIPVGLAEPDNGAIRPAQLAYLTADVSETLILTELS